MGKFKSALNRVATARGSVRRKELLLSLVSLILVTLILVSTTVCWFVMKSATMDTGGLQLKASNGLLINGLDDDGAIHITNNTDLIPATSVDGQNLYFPADGTFSSNTEEMTFRKANAGDRNIRYIQLDFDVTAESNNTSVYVDPSSYVYLGDGTDAERTAAAEPLRVAIMYEGIGTNGIVFNPYRAKTIAKTVRETDNSSGYAIEYMEQVCHVFSEYSYEADNPILTLKAGEKKRMSVIVWLEGTDDKCDDNIVGKKISLDIKFNTSWDKTQTIKLIDGTDIDSTSGKRLLAKTIDEGGSLILNYTNNNNSGDYVMYKSGDAWYCNVPANAVSDIKFKLLSADGTQVAEWTNDINGNSTLNRGTFTTYLAEGSGTKAYGSWQGSADTGGGGSDGDEFDKDWW